MGETTLVEGKVAEAAALVRELDSRGDSPSAAVWYFYDDAEQWQLLLAGQTFDPLLPAQEPLAYRKVADAMNALTLSSLWISEVKVVSSEYPILKALRRLLRTPAEALTSAYFTDTTIDGLFIKEMVILRSA